MLECSHCHQPVEAQAISCPHCRTVLKAHGHPGITLYRANGNEYLCQSCTYEHDDTCNYPQRPYAKECTLYTNIAQQAIAPKSYAPSRSYALQLWIKRNAGWLFLVGLIVISIVITLSGR
jgi:hypothetical protein